MKYKISRIMNIRARFTEQTQQDMINAAHLQNLLSRHGSIPIGSFKKLSGLGSSAYKRAFRILNQKGLVWNVSGNYEPAGETVKV